jgi:flagellar biosynthesis protein FliP
MGFVLLLPFLAVDLIVANILVGLGMFMVSPAMISLPLKILLFVAGDGWLLLFKGLYLSYQV